MIFEQTPLADVIVVRPRVFGDERGFFMESWNQQTCAEAGYDWTFVQDNQSRSSQGILRGMHFQTEQSQGKLVRVTQGRVFDAVVDLRRSSPSFGQWFGIELNATEHTMLYMPPGCAHGFYVQSESADFLYKTTDYYHPQSEVCLAWDDPSVGIEWPLVEDQPPQVSAKDATGLSWEQLPYYD
ncbi:dTDP-4-dehydrorhamnose 3,5-epimerase [Halieaceae bacterium IMCC14734]|uniref:dTDP-4-dehydrorhamnose 3,5-epimerase n=1 Tax=Candidatus Litorirhabdus singularis TaxID=2518993 RepID=A0ABT3TEQ4_9GAMM|nr:dTDP-4-dehydrorhamnose 3,5-epimerase [Candidatus Litorirhabdus singularis]MCX2979907.1 dTDP-4-dehydrorhamnose 3,5-epimerase [Candidatus Litorirhabdus singularis]